MSSLAQCVIVVTLFAAACLATTAANGAVKAPVAMNLAGKWRFALDRTAEQLEPAPAGREAPALPAGESIAQEWFKRDLPDRIRLPGILQAQGYGNDISTNTPWVLGLGDAWWKLQPQSLRDHFSQPGNVEVPFLSQPPKHYLGVAWYQRDIRIPAKWRGSHFLLFLERAHWKTTVWLDDKEFAPNDSLVAPHITDLGIIGPGNHRLSIRVDNRTQLPSQGHLVDGHSVSDALGATWNGIVGRIGLQVSSPVWIESAQVFPNVSNKTALIKVSIGNATGRPGSGNLSVGNNSVAVAWEADGGTAQIEVTLRANAKLWNEFHPELQHLTVSLTGDGANDSKPLVFGLRQITHDDKELLVNGRAVNLRTTHFGGDFPLTGYPATDVESWKKIIETCQDFGLNGIRFHSWCPPEAAFTAADEMGFYLQPECGMWNDFSSPEMKQRLEDETEHLLRAYGNHPSFILLSPSNEPRNYARFTPDWAARWYAKDNRRLYSAGTGWSDPSQVNGGAQFATLVRFGRGQLRNTSGWFGNDFRTALENVHIPVLAHEIGQWCAYPDFDVIEEFTGYLRPGNYEIFKYIARQEGVLAYDHTFAWASGRFQLECYKEELEANLRTPGLAGYQMLDLRDYLGQGTALIGVVNAFWKPKSYVTGAEFRRFNSETVPLARLSRRTFTSDETLESEAEIYHFGEKPLHNAMPYWKVVDSAGWAVASGEFETRNVPIGRNIPLGQVSVDLSRLKAPGAYKLVVGLRDTEVQNDWRFWLYPAEVDQTTPQDVLVTSAWSEAENRLAAGGKVLFLPDHSALDRTKCPPMSRTPVFWNIQMTVRPPQNPSPRFDAMLGLLCETNHPALAEFPTEANCDWQWTQIVNGVRSVNLSSAPRSLRPIVAAIDDWNRNWRLGVIFECNVGPGRLLVSAINLNDKSARLELLQLRRSLLDYVAGDKFRPKAALTTEQVESLWLIGGNNSPASEPRRVFDPDLDSGSTANSSDSVGDIAGKNSLP